MNIATHTQNGIVILEINGRLDAEHAEILKNEFSKLIPANSMFLLDLSGMDYLDSTGLGAIVFCLKSCGEHGGVLKLANLTDKPRIIFEITRAYKIFDIYDNLDAALAAM